MRHALRRHVHNCAAIYTAATEDSLFNNMARLSLFDERNLSVKQDYHWHQKVFMAKFCMHTDQWLKLHPRKSSYIRITFQIFSI